MQFTVDEMEKIHEASLAELACRLVDAIRSHDSIRFRESVSSLREFAEDLSVPLAMRAAARAVLDNAALHMTTAGMAQLAASVDELACAGSGLRGALRVLETGKAAFFVASLAAASKRSLVVLTAFDDAAGQLNAARGQLDGVAEALGLARAALERLGLEVDAARADAHGGAELSRPGTRGCESEH